MGKTRSKPAAHRDATNRARQAESASGSHHHPHRKLDGSAQHESKRAGAHDAKPAGQSETPAAASIGGELTVYRAAELRGKLSQQIADGVRRFDLSGVTDFDSAGLQLLAAIRASAAREMGDVEFLNPPACVREVCELCGLSPWLTGHAEAA